MPAAEHAPSPTAVLDASALMAFIHGENGKAAVRAALDGRAVIGVVNWAEVLSKSAERGDDPAALEAAYREQGFIGEVLTIEPLTEADCVAVAATRVATRPHGLSLADRVCLALAARLGVPALTADRAWATADTSAKVQLIR